MAKGHALVRERLALLFDPYIGRFFDEGEDRVFVRPRPVRTCGARRFELGVTVRASPSPVLPLFRSAGIGTRACRAPGAELGYRATRRSGERFKP